MSGKINQNFFSLVMPSTGQIFHVLAQYSYLAVLTYYIKASRYFDWYIISVLYAYLINLIGYRVILKKEQLQLTLTPLIITNSIFVFITGYSLFTYFLAVTIAICSRFYIRVNERPVFNPSILAVSMMYAIGEGFYPTPVIAVADKNWWILLILGFGLITSQASRRFFVSIAYLTFFILFVLIFHFIGHETIIIQIGTLFGISNLIYSFHVITDPQTSPFKFKEMIKFGMILGLIDVILRMLEIVGSTSFALNIVTAFYTMFNEKQVNLIRKIIFVLIPFCIVGFGMIFGSYPKNLKNPFHYNNYQTENFKKLTPFYYENITERIGSFNSVDLDSGNKNISKKAVLFNSLPAPVFAVEDYNNDGFFDLLVSGSRNPFQLYRNVNGKYFKIDDQFIDFDENKHGKIIYATFLDFNNDGEQEIFAVTENETHPFLLFVKKNESYILSQSIFKNVSSNPGRITSVSLLDFNNDGFIDILVANFPRIESINLNSNIGRDFSFSKQIKENLLFKNNKGVDFSEVSHQVNFFPNEFTHAVGVSDLNNDGFPDLYFSNDYGRDKILVNNHGKFYSNVTNQVLGNIFNRNGMGVDFADLFGNGFQGIYVSNISSGFARHGMNYLWTRGEEFKYENESNKLNIGRCGYSWGPKFFDPNLDGELDLFVGAGYKKGESESWFLLSSWSLMPNFFKSHPMIAERFPSNLDIAGNNRNCLFLNYENQFVDIANDVGFDEANLTHTTALIDFENNGSPFIINGNFRSPRIQIYKNTKKIENNWIGLELIGTKSNRNAIGAKILISKNGKRFTRELYPTNGLSTLHDRRIIIGLKDKRVLDLIEIRWPSGNIQKVTDIKLNQYNRIFEMK